MAGGCGMIFELISCRIYRMKLLRLVFPIFLLVLVVGYLLIDKFALEHYDENTKLQFHAYYKSVLLVGEISGYDHGCNADGTCAFIVNGTPVAHIYGWGGCEDKMGGVYLLGTGDGYNSPIDDKSIIGKKVVVYGRKYSYSNEVTLCGDKSYFIREV
jgi:hypothetical protein